MKNLEEMLFYLLLIKSLKYFHWKLLSIMYFLLFNNISKTDIFFYTLIVRSINDSSLEIKE